MAIYLGEQKINAVMQPYVSGIKTVQIGAVANIKFSIISGKLKVGWSDPADIYHDGSLVSAWKKTRLVFNAYPAGTEITPDSYPDSPEDFDGLVLECDQRDKYRYVLFNSPLTFDPDMIYCFRFFTCNTYENWSTDEKFKGSCIFRSSSETWKTLVDKLERFPEMWDDDPSQSILVHPGGEVELNYILNDQSNFTRADFMTNLNSLTSVVAPFTILDYNANVPQYVKYVKDNGDGTKTYKWVSSLDDSTQVIQVKDTHGITTSEKMLTGDMTFRPIRSNCRVYEQIYDPIGLQQMYVDTDEVVLSSSYDTSCFEYRGNLSAQTINLYKAPMQIKIGSDTFDFVGYTMTLQSRSALYANGNTITFDLDEFGFASPFNYFEAGKEYFYKDGSAYQAIDTSDLIGKNISTFKVGGSQVEVFSRITKGDAMTSESSRYCIWKPYYKVTGGPVEADAVIKSFKTSNIFKGCVAGEKVAYNNAIYNVLQDIPTSYVVPPSADAGTYYQQIAQYASTKMTCCYDWVAGGVYAVNAYVYYNTKSWKVIKATTATLVGTPETLTAYYQVANLGTKDVDWCVDGEIIPCDESLVLIEGNDGNRTSYGNNLYSESNIRQWLNVAAGRDDDWFVMKNRFDRRTPKTNMYATSNFPLKLAKNDDFFEHVVPAAMPTRISDVQYQYMSVPTTTKYTGGQRQIITADRFFLLSYAEVGWSAYDTMNTYSNIFYNDNSRKKYNMGSNGVISTTSTANWWLRNPHTGYSHHEYLVNTSGGSDSYSAHVSFGCVPACILG